MKKKIAYLIVIISLFGMGAFLLLIAPYHIYTLTIAEGVNTKFLKMPKSSSKLYDSTNFDLSKDSNHSVDEYFYKEMHFSHFKMLLPVNHPAINSIPIIKIERNGARLGISYIDGKSNELASFSVERPIKMETSFNEQKLLMLPIFKNYILKKSENELWYDLFSKKLSLPSSEGKSFLESLVALQAVSYHELVYNLFILINRNMLFPNDLENFGLHVKNKVGVIELTSTQANVKFEKVYILRRGIVYPLLLKTKIGNEFAENFRKRIIANIEYKETSPDSSIPIYAEYKRISYNKKIEEQGMSYLYSAWSHDIDNKEYVRVMILFLERGSSNLKYLKPFYEYAYKKFGTNLSSDGELRLETGSEKLKRKMDEELEKEIAGENQMNAAKNEGEFETADEKIEYNLKRAKEKKYNSDNDKKNLIME